MQRERRHAMNMQTPAVAALHQVDGGIGNRVDRRTDLPVITHPVLGQDGTIGGAGDQLGARPLLDGAQVTADHAVIATQILGRPPHAAQPGNGVERAQGVERRQPFRDGSAATGGSIRRRSSADIMISGSQQRALIQQPSMPTASAPRPIHPCRKASGVAVHTVEVAVCG